MKNNKILIIFDHPLSLRSYIETSCLDVLSSNFDCELLFINSKKNYFSVENKSLKNSKIILNRFEKFIISIYSYFYWNTVKSKSLSIKTRLFIQNNISDKNIFKAAVLGLWCYKYLPKLTPKLTDFLLIVFKKKLSKVVQNGFDIVLYITVGGPTTFSDQLVRFYDNLKIVVVSENWDNISSKSVLKEKPLALVVWGQQSSKFANLIHGFSSNLTHDLGNPRLEWLLNNCSKTVSSNSGIFFGGGSTNFEGEKLYLESCIKIAKNLGLNVIYLPHPKYYSFARKLKYLENFSNFKLIGANKILNNTEYFLPNMREYLNIFKNTKIFISSYSTLNLEAAVLGKFSIGIDLELGILKNHINYKMSDAHDHINDLKESKLIYRVQSILEFESVLNSSINNQFIEFSDENRSEEISYLAGSSFEFTHKLVELLKQLIIEDKYNKPH